MWLMMSRPESSKERRENLGLYQSSELLAQSLSMVTHLEEQAVLQLMVAVTVRFLIGGQSLLRVDKKQMEGYRVRIGHHCCLECDLEEKDFKLLMFKHF